MRLGEAYHRLVVRHRLGLPIAPPPALAGAWAAFIASPFGMPSSGEEVFSEQTLQFALEGVPFLVRCDEIRRQGDQWTILDWKTGRVREADLPHQWQTRLYCFALALAGSAIGATGAIPPGSIKMVYLLVRLEKTFEVPYDLAAFEADRTVLTEIAHQVDAPLESLAWPERSDTCRTCRFDSLCNARPAPPVTSKAPSSPRFVHQVGRGPTPSQETPSCGT
jgi:CRISPR/Cas system-associated exonuclease Cas4 (RecB family)